ncbi:PIG-U-domain-containing protein [Lentinula lateritia]|nr:PIG-U-domain-containing protein [Lentinula lateritia]
MSLSTNASSPLTSYANLREGMWLYRRGVDVYADGAGRVALVKKVIANWTPFLFLFTNLSPFLSTLFEIILWITPDALSAWFLVRMSRARTRSTASSSRDILLPSLLPPLYLLSPFHILPSLARSTSAWENAVLLGAVAFFSSPAQSKSLLLLALRIHLSLDAIVLLPPLLMLILAGPGSRLMDPVFPVILEFLVYFAALSLVSTLIVGHWEWMGRTWGASLSLPSLSPNPGLWWYFFTEMFDHFRAFFLVVFEVHLLMYVAPICIKFQHDPLYALFLLTGILATFKPYPTLSDQGLFLVMWGIFGEVYPFLRTPLPALLTLLHSTLLQPLFAHLWLTHGRGNANFYYATTLVGACAGGMGVVDGVWAGLRCALEKREKGKDGNSNTESVDEEWEESEVVTQQ